MIAQVSQSQEKLSIQLERATREHAVKMQLMQSEYETLKQQLNDEINELTTQRTTLRDEITQLSELQGLAEEISGIRQDLEQQREGLEREQKQLQQQVEAANFEKQRELTARQREQEVELAELAAKHRKAVLELNKGALKELLETVGMEQIDPSELESLRARAEEQQTRTENEVQEIREEAIEQLKRKFSISSSEPLNVTELFYTSRSLQEECAQQEKQIEKLESEIARMRAHVESESARVAKAIEAARPNIENKIESGAKN